MIQITNNKNCCGCSACQSICPQNAITMEPDILGFKYPKINYSLCTNCGLCEKVCVFTETKISEPYEKDFPIVFGARHKNINQITSSQSGAAFIALSDYVLKHNGIIYGVGYGKHFKAQHKRATNSKERDEFKGSKYVQSDIDGIFSLIKKDLINNTLVLFSGTPCQVSGLKSYIGKKLSNNLICVDIICHGVPSPKIWSDYLDYLESKYNDKLVKVNFRDKNIYGWNTHYESFLFKKKEAKIVKSTYSSLFYEHIMLRPSCSICRYTTIYRDSDFTIADFWGFEKVNPNFFPDNKGCSLLFINNSKAENLFQYIKDDFNLLPTSSPEDYMQPNLKEPSIFPKDYTKFQENYKHKGFKYVIHRENIHNIKIYAHKITQCLLNPQRLFNKLKTIFQ